MSLIPKPRFFVLRLSFLSCQISDLILPQLAIRAGGGDGGSTGGDTDDESIEPPKYCTHPRCHPTGLSLLYVCGVDAR